MNDGTAFQKRRQLLDMLDKGLVMLHLDPRPEEVAVPAHLKTEPILRLNLAYGFRLPALDVGAEGVYAVLSFNRANFGCTIPWSAVFAMTTPDNGHDGVMWPDSLPPELKPAGDTAGASSVRLKPVVGSTGTPGAVGASNPSASPTTGAESSAEAPPREADTSAASTEPAIADHPGEAPLVSADTTSDKPRRSHLRLVKG
jgi:hypothetical protein